MPIGSGLGLTGPDERTVCAVVSAPFGNLGNTSFGYGILVWGPGDAASGDLWSLAIASNAKLQIKTAFGQTVSHPGTLTSDGWHFVSAVQDGTRLGDVTLYLDGETPYGEGFWSTEFTHAGDAFMGPAGAGMNGGFKAGRHAYMLVYNRALSAAEIEQNRQALKSILASRAIVLP